MRLADRNDCNVAPSKTDTGKLSSSIAHFPEELLERQFQIKPLHFMVFHHSLSWFCLGEVSSNSNQGWKVTCFCFNYNYNYSLKFSITITIIQVQVIVIQLQFQLQWKDSQNIATNSLTYEALSFAYASTVDLFCISIPDL